MSSNRRPPRRPATLTQLLSPVISGALVLAAAASLSGCSAIADTLHRQHEEQFDSYAQAESGWVGVAMPSWIPADATNLRNLATNDEIDAVIGVDSSDPLPSDCGVADRVGAPFASSAAIPPLTSLPDRVIRCGDYEVVARKGGWMGWYQGVEPGDRPTR